MTGPTSRSPLTPARVADPRTGYLAPGAAAPRVVETRSSGHRFGGGDPGIREFLTADVDWKHLGREPDHYEYREEWANRKSTLELMYAKGIRSFETDVLPTAKSVDSPRDVVVTHNSEIDGQKTWEWLASDLEQKGWSTLEDMLDTLEQLVATHGGRPMLFTELKGALSTERATDIGDKGLMPASVEMVHQVVDSITQRVEAGTFTYDELPLISFNHPMLALAKKLNPELKIGLSFAQENLGLTNREMATVTQRPDYKAFVIDRMIGDALAARAYSIAPDSRFLTRELVEAAHAAGLEVHGWTAYQVEEPITEMLEWGVDTLITDLPLAVEAAKQNLANA